MKHLDLGYVMSDGLEGLVNYDDIKAALRRQESGVYGSLPEPDSLMAKLHFSKVISTHVDRHGKKFLIFTCNDEGRRTTSVTPGHPVK